MLRERLLPREYLNYDANDVLDSYLEWCGPLIGGDLPAFAPRVS